MNPDRHFEALAAQLAIAQDSGGPTAGVRAAMADAAADATFRKIVEFYKKPVTFRPLAA